MKLPSPFPIDYAWFKNLLYQTRMEKAMGLVIAILIFVGMYCHIFQSSYGMSVLPLSFITGKISH